MARRRTGAAIELPADLADRIRTVFRFDRRPETFGEWGERMTRTYEADLDRTLTPEDLCLVESSNHVARVGDDVYHYQCTLDAFVVGYLADEPVTVESTPPTSETTVTAAFAPGDVRSHPEGSVLSFGIAPNAGPPDGAITPEKMYGQLCPYGHAFPSEAEYEEWAAATDAITTAIDLVDGLETAWELLHLWELGESD